MAATKKNPETETEEESNAVATTTGGELVSADLGFDFEGDANAGLEGATADSFAIPFLTILQKGSPAVDEADGKYIQGARPGMLMNTVTQELYDGKEGVVFIPCQYQRRFLRWAPRGNGEGSGFRGEMTPEEVARLQHEGKIVEFEGKSYFPLDDGSVNPNKCDRLSDHRNHFGMIIGEDGIPQQVLLSLTSTQIKRSKALMTMLSQKKVQGRNGLVTPPTFMNLIRVRTEPEQNDKGSWYSWKFAMEGTVTDKDIYDIGKAMHEAVQSDEVNVNYEAASDSADSDSDGDQF